MQIEKGQLEMHGYRSWRKQLQKIRYGASLSIKLMLSRAFLFAFCSRMNELGVVDEGRLVERTVGKCNPSRQTIRDYSF